MTMGARRASRQCGNGAVVVARLEEGGSAHAVSKKVRMSRSEAPETSTISSDLRGRVRGSGVTRKAPCSVLYFAWAARHVTSSQDHHSELRMLVTKGIARARRYGHGCRLRHTQWEAHMETHLQRRSRRLHHVSRLSHEEGEERHPIREGRSRPYTVGPLRSTDGEASTKAGAARTARIESAEL